MAAKKWLTSVQHARSMTVLRAPHAIPLGVVLTTVGPGPISEPHQGDEEIVLDASQLSCLAACAHDAALLDHLVALHRLEAADIALERDAWNLWYAGMYAGTIRVRVYAHYAERHSPRKQKRAAPQRPPAAEHWHAVLPHVCIDAAEWHALSRESDTLAASAPMFWIPGLVRAPR